MNTRARTGRFMWLMGLVLLAGSVVGTGWVLHQPASGDGPSTNGQAFETPLGVVGLGFVDIEPGITFLHPVQGGRVKQVFVKEGDEVKEGTRLLSLDNSAARLRLLEAQGAVDAAQHELTDTQEKLAREQQREIEIQQYTLEAAKHELQAARFGLEFQRSLYNNKAAMLVTKEQVDETDSKVKALEAKVKAHEAAVKKAKDFNPKGTLDRLRDQLRIREAQRDLAQRGVFECDLYAPADGVVLRLFATVGDSLNTTPKVAAVHFCPNLPRIVRVEILQEWASKVQAGQLAFVEDDTRNGAQWKGKVARVSDWFTQRRSLLMEPFQYNDVRTLECIVYLDPGSKGLHMGQRVRVTIK
jgi:multidrug resistance efflux pump